MVTHRLWESGLQFKSDIFYHLRVLYNFGFVVCPICVRELPFAILLLLYLISFFPISLPLFLQKPLSGHLA